MNARRTTILVFLVSGALVGLAGMVQLFGNDLYMENIGAQGWHPEIGFTAITVALLGRNRPVGILFGALLVAVLNTGVVNAEIGYGIFPDLATIVLGFMVLCVATPALITRRFHLRPGRLATFNFGGWG